MSIANWCQNIFLKYLSNFIYATFENKCMVFLIYLLKQFLCFELSVNASLVFGLFIISKKKN